MASFLRWLPGQDALLEAFLVAQTILNLFLFLFWDRKLQGFRSQIVNAMLYVLLLVGIGFIVVLALTGTLHRCTTVLTV
jgi:hypothetical protein